MYYTAEVQHGAHILPENWEPTLAYTLDGAKRTALRRQMFQGTTLYVGERLGLGEPFVIARKVADPINPDQRGRWEEVTEDAPWMS